jgi:hypothetical protein
LAFEIYYWSSIAGDEPGFLEWAARREMLDEKSQMEDGK